MNGAVPSGATVTSRRGVSAKNRDKAIQNSREILSQTPVKDKTVDTGLTATMGATQASMTQPKNLLTKRNKKPAYMQSLNE